MRSPGLLNLDFSAAKETRITERWRVQFRAESFNLANRVNLLSPNTTFLPGPDGLNRSASFGQITSSRDPRNVQLALKLIF